MFIVPMTLFSWALRGGVVRGVHDETRIDDGVDLGRLHHAAQQRVLGADLDVLGPLELDLGLLVVDADHRLDLREGFQRLRQAPAPIGRTDR